MILQIVGYKNTGKTTLMRQTIKLLKSLGLKVATVKNHGHGGEITLQDSNVDHMKHFSAGADQSIVQGENYRQTVTHVAKQNLKELIAESVTIDSDIILVEGFKDAPYDKVIVYHNQADYHKLTQLSNVQYHINLSEEMAYKQYEAWLLTFLRTKGLIR
ncbi:molybdopterin-guanine dinucleotide biosynthesis protein B [Staphylococcus sp. 18_1_E_LY]|uniref:Molybdopterin-guanine dinucleotide biosynthesis protein B n=1 Tax=Staphylococcus lloydii TaxID=2781774 RepID=A0A7T1B130_9STAP|nr:molybdopterin-guanine dinucleotide biosynthesis protein B [Staphylococcus lloydii]MBF7020448.1 molybdopterin-guanine dinucleotide biosynthesis protein B [Staphylococcus lloydii]MBF7028131.1 molybdopterin-guanine dinucleotide biosynthesis protein B [Staphylococcus lloydii]QPM75794.1 molybdopterin-guanine dinucleotide biosynthesis protein B [Staphylococcus lloydii]